MRFAQTSRSAQSPPGFRIARGFLHKALLHKARDLLHHRRCCQHSKAHDPEKPVPDMIRDGYRSSGKIMRKSGRMIPKSGYRFSDKIMLKNK